MYFRFFVLLFALTVATHAMAAPDVIVGELFGETFNFDTVRRWGKLNAADPITAYSVGTMSCNVGADPVSWDISTNNHPVIGTQFYRYMDGRLEQIGLSWVKHGFLALDEDHCNPGGCMAPPQSDPNWGLYLFPGCSDPYSSGLNGNQPRLGPRSEINVVTGQWGAPFLTSGQSGNTIYKRLQLHDVDIDPDLNPGALYFIEGQYVTHDDTNAGTNHNNVSYRQVVVTQVTSTNFALAMTGMTFREQSAIRAWQAIDPNVQIETITVPSDGIFMLGSNATDLGNGEYEYEYALYNQDSHRSAGSISIPLGTNASATNTGFHDVDYHSGDGVPFGTTFSGTDWTPTVGASSVTWATESFATNSNANALRWGTLYNFRFRSNGAPKPGLITVGLYRPGTPSSFTIAGVVPDNAASVVPNDYCADATPIGDGVFSFDTTGATTDGPDEPGACDFFSYSHIEADVWYRYTAACSGHVSVSLCGSAYDTKLAVYDAVCPAVESAVGCDDDACNGTTRSELTFSALSGEEYLIRIGGYQGATGSGSMTFECIPVIGDMNANGFVDLPDIPLFVALLLDPSSATPDAKTRGDMDLDLENNAVDIQLFVDALVP